MKTWWLRSLAGPFGCALLAACGSGSEAGLMDPSAAPAVTVDASDDQALDDAQVPDAAEEPVVDASAPQDVAEADAEQEDAAPPPPPNPFEPPAVEVAVWKGKLPPGGLFSPGIRVTYPTPLPQDGPYPLVLFAHGMSLGEDDYAATFEHIAKFGYVVASVDFEENLLDMDHHAPVEAMQKAVELLSTESPPELLGRADLTTFVAAGHSLGGKAAVWLALEDARVAAVVALDPVDDAMGPGAPSEERPSLAPERMGEMTVPGLYVAAQLSPTGTTPCAAKSSNACRFVESTPAEASPRLYVLQDFGHMQFVDAYGCMQCHACARGPQDAHEPKQVLARGLMVAFLEDVIRGRSESRYWLEGEGIGQLQAADGLLDVAEQLSFCALP